MGKKKRIKVTSSNGAFCGRAHKSIRECNWDVGSGGEVAAAVVVEGGAVNYAARHPVMLRYHLT